MLAGVAEPTGQLEHWLCVPRTLAGRSGKRSEPVGPDLRCPVERGEFRVGVEQAHPAAVRLIRVMPQPDRPCWLVDPLPAHRVPPSCTAKAAFTS